MCIRDSEKDLHVQMSSKDLGILGIWHICFKKPNNFSTLQGNKCFFSKMHHSPHVLGVLPSYRGIKRLVLGSKSNIYFFVVIVKTGTYLRWNHFLIPTFNFIEGIQATRNTEKNSNQVQISDYRSCMQRAKLWVDIYTHGLHETKWSQRFVSTQKSCKIYID